MLMRALSSVLAQSYSNIELIVVDDSDASFAQRNEVRELVAAHRYSRFPVHYLSHSCCRGLSAARNTGISAAKGEYIAFLDDDDEWLPHKATSQITVFQNNTDKTGLIYSPGFVKNDDTGEMTELFCRYERGNVYDTLLAGNWIGYPSFVMFRHSALLEVGGFDENIPYMEDYDLYLRVALHYLVDYSKTSVAIYHEHNNGQMTNDIKRYIAGLEYLSDKFYDDLERCEYAKRKMAEKLTAAYAEL